MAAEDVTVFRGFMMTCLGSRVTEQTRLDNGRPGGCWFTVNRKTYDLACTKEHGGGQGRLHHVTQATDQREDILKTADIFLENGVHIETSPHKHAIQGTFLLHVREPAGNRIELANAATLDDLGLTGGLAAPIAEVQEAQIAAGRSIAVAADLAQTLATVLAARRPLD